MGYEYGGLRPQFCAAIADFPEGSGDPAQAMAPADLAGMKSCVEEMASHHNGVMGARELSYWDKRVLARSGEGVSSGPSSPAALTRPAR